MHVFQIEVETIAPERDRKQEELQLQIPKQPASNVIAGVPPSFLAADTMKFSPLK